MFASRLTYPSRFGILPLNRMPTIGCNLGEKFEYHAPVRNYQVEHL